MDLIVGIECLTLILIFIHGLLVGGPDQNDYYSDEGQTTSNWKFRTNFVWNSSTCWVVYSSREIR